MATTFVSASDGRAFQLLKDTISIKVAASETKGRYSSIFYRVGPHSVTVPHTHANFEETFYVLSGTMRVLVGDSEQDVGPGDFVRVPPNTRHGFYNTVDTPVEMLVSFAPGGIEELFYSYRTEAPEDFDLKGYLADAAAKHKTRYEISST